MKNGENNMKYRFVYKNGGWWLMIRNTDELIDYNEKTSLSNPIMNGLKNIIAKDFDKVDPCNTAEYLIKLHAESNNTGICEATEDLLSQRTNAQIKCLVDGKNWWKSCLR